MTSDPQPVEAEDRDMSGSDAGALRDALLAWVALLDASRRLDDHQRRLLLDLVSYALLAELEQVVVEEASIVTAEAAR